MSEKLHHVFSPSQLGALEVCPCYQANQSEHIKAFIGTLQHKVTETGVDDLRLSDDEIAASAQCMDFVAAHRAALDENRRQAVLSLIASLWGSLVRSGEPADAELLAESRIPQIEELKEVYLPIDDCRFNWLGETFEGTTGGYADRVLLSHDRKQAVLIDFKFGQWKVEDAATNPQGIAYSLGLFKKYAELQSVEVFFYQPHINSISSAVFKRENLVELYLRICTIVARASEAQFTDPPNWGVAKANYPTCLFCSRIGQCPEVAELVLKVSKKFYPAAIPENLFSSDLLDSAQAAQAIRVAQIAETAAKAIRRQITERALSSGVSPEGYTLASRTPREIVEPKKFKEVALRSLTPEEFESTVSYEFGKVETLVRDKAERGQKKAAVEKLDAEWRDAGAVADGEAFCFLKAKNEAN